MKHHQLSNLILPDLPSAHCSSVVYETRAIALPIPLNECMIIQIGLVTEEQLLIILLCWLADQVTEIIDCGGKH